MTQDEVKEIFSNDASTGEFTWLVANSTKIKIGDRAGSVHKASGYRVIRVNGKLYKEHRLAWLYHYGYMPTKQLDHINGDRSDNRITNLREATNAENHQNLGKNKNNTSGFTGVTDCGNKWRAYIHKDGKKHHLGYHITREDAHAAHLKAKSELHTFQPTLRK